MQLLRSILFTTFMILSVPFAALAIVVCFFTPLSFRFGIARSWTLLVLWVLKWVCGLDYTVEGQEHIPSKASIAMIKHSSALETIVELSVFPQQTWALKRELMWLPFFGWGAALLRPIAVHRGAGRSAVNQLVQQGLQRLREGIWVMIFPEGTRVAAGQTGRYGIGGAALAARSKRLIVPVAHNAGDYWPRRGWLKKPGTVRFVIGPPIEPGNREPREILLEVKDWIETTTAQIRADAGHGPAAPASDAATSSQD